MAHCDEYLELISAAIDGALSPARQEELNAHLELCPECRALYEELTALHAALMDLPAVEVPADLTGRIMGAIAAEQALPFPPAEKKKAPIHWQRWLASAAVLAVVLMGTWSWKPWESRGMVDDPPAAEAQRPESIQAAPEASQAAADAALPTDNDELLFSAAKSVPDPEPYMVENELVGAALDTAPMALNEEPQDGETAEEVPPAAYRMVPSGGEEVTDDASPEEVVGDGRPALRSTLPPEETEAPAVQPFMVTSALAPSETVVPAEVSAREALERLVDYIFAYSGYDSVEFMEEEAGLYAQVTAPGHGGSIYFLPEEDDEDLYWFEFHPELGDDVYYCTVDRLTGEPTSLLGERDTPLAQEGQGAHDALERLLEEHPFPGCETWEYGEIEEGWRSPVWTRDSVDCWLQYECFSEKFNCYGFNVYEDSANDDYAPATYVGYSVPADGGEITIAGN